MFKSSRKICLAQHCRLRHHNENSYFCHMARNSNFRIGPLSWGFKFRYSKILRDFVITMNTHNEHFKHILRQLVGFGFLYVQTGRIQKNFNSRHEILSS